MEKLLEDMRKAMHEELDRATAKHGEKHHSPAEAYAVMLEEVEEAQDQIDSLCCDVGNFWEEVKNNWNTLECADSIREHALSAAADLIQVAAMAQKAIRGYEVDKS